ncbi:MAG: site-2 protease family protein [Deltaproteobacteria bacterium]|nr:site-2 protease family protein [Deltaproteobacteria bacterium]MBW2396048.1 site-2 protease family protein [Deltaproteobacteria bacterium]
MKWSFKLGTLAGIAVYVHATFFILLAWFTMSGFRAGQSPAEIVATLFFVLALFGCVVLHELGHALMARRYGIATRDITLLPIGGVARLERMPEDPGQEFRVAMAGPAVNVVIASILWVGLRLAGGATGAPTFDLTGGPFLERLMVVNVVLVVFNLLPAFPMDGGRALRALLASRMGHARATRIAASIGQSMALGFGALGLFGNPFLILIALFVWIGAAGEANAAQLKHALAGIPVAQAMLTDFEVLSPGDPLQRAVALTLAGSQKAFPVVDGDRAVGMLSQQRLLQALAAGGQERPVAQAMEGDIEPADSGELLEPLLARLQSTPSGALPVTHEGRIVGLITLDNASEFLGFRAALEKRGS